MTNPRISAEERAEKAIETFNVCDADSYRTCLADVTAAIQSAERDTAKRIWEKAAIVAETLRHIDDSIAPWPHEIAAALRSQGDKEKAND